MNINTAVKHSFFFMFIFFTTSGYIDACEKLQPLELSIYAGQLFSSNYNGHGITNIVFQKEGTTNNIVVKSEEATVSKINNIGILSNPNSLVGTTQIVERTYRAIILPPMLSSRTIRFDLGRKAVDTSNIARSISDNYTISSLGDKGAIVLINQNDLQSCINYPRTIYLLPSSSSIEPELLKQSIKISDEKFSNLIAKILSVNSGNYFDFNKIEDYFSAPFLVKENELRRQMFLNPVQITFDKHLSSITKAAEESGDTISLALWRDYTKAIRSLSLPGDIFGIEQKMREHTRESVFRDYYEILDSNATNLIDPSVRAKVDEFISKGGEYIGNGTIINKLAEKQLKELLELKNANPGSRSIARVTAMFKRNLGNFRLDLKHSKNQYEHIYNFRNGQVPLNNDMGFDESQLEQSILTLDDGSEIKAQKFEVADQVISVVGEKYTLKGNMLVLYRSFLDPVYNITLVRPTFLFYFDVSNLKKQMLSLFNKQLPNNTCQDRYRSMGAVSFKHLNGSLFAGSQFDYERWFCEDFDWICFKGWVPRTCREEFKTKIFTTSIPVGVKIYASLGSQKKLKLHLSSNYIDETEYFDLEVLDMNGFNEFRETSNLRLLLARFDVESQKGNILLIIKGVGKKMRQNTVVDFYSEVESTFGLGQ